MTCLDANPLHYPGYPPYINWPYELSKTPSVFYAQCTVPGGATSFYAQIDTCDNSGADIYCNTYGYVLENDELGSSPSYVDNIRGPVAAGGSSGGGVGSGGLFLPFIARNP